MSVVYVGDCEFKEAADADLDVDPFGMDRLIRTFEGRRDKLAQFLATLRKYTPDTEFKQLTLTRYTPQLGRAFVRVSVEFNGLFNDELPDVVTEGGSHNTTVLLESASGTQTEIEYYAPTSTFRYITRSRPKKRKYKGRILATDEQFQIRERRGNKTGRLIAVPRVAYGNVSASTVLANRLGFQSSDVNPEDFRYFIDVVSGPFTFSEVGRYWQCVETNQGRITDEEDEKKLELGTAPPSAAEPVTQNG